MAAYGVEEVGVVDVVASAIASFADRASHKSCGSYSTACHWRVSREPEHVNYVYNLVGLLLYHLYDLLVASAAACNFGWETG